MKSFRCMRIGVFAGVVVASLLSVNSYGQAIVGVNLTNTITASMDGGTAKNGATWYEMGVNGAAPQTGIQLGIVPAEWDPLSLYLFQPADQLNVLMLDSGSRTGSMTFTRPISAVSLSLAGASGNGTGTNTATLRFQDGSTTTVGPFTVGDWFFNELRVQTADGRINIFGNSFANVNSDNPRILPINYTLSEADQLKFLTSVDFSWTGSGANTHTALFGISADFTGLGHFSPVPMTAGSFNQDVIVGLSEVPEPGALSLFGLGAFAALVARLRRKAS